MIRINLFGEEEDRSAANALQLLIALGALMLTIVICFFVQTEANSKLSKYEEDKIKLEESLKRLKKVTEKVNGLESNKKLLEEKLRTIATLKVKKHGPVHILDEVNNAVPERAWLTSFSQRENSLNISGVAFDNQTISQFMERLKQSSYFTDVDLLQSLQHMGKDNVKLKNFVLKVNIRDLLSLQTGQEMAKESSAVQETTAKKTNKKI